MNGANAVPAVKTMSTANRRSTMINGSSQNFFRTFKNCQSSVKNSIFGFCNLIRCSKISLGIGMIAFGKYGTMAIFKFFQL